MGAWVIVLRVAKVVGLSVTRSIVAPVFLTAMVVVALAPPATLADQLDGFLGSAETEARNDLPWPRTSRTAAAALTRPLLWSRAG